MNWIHLEHHAGLAATDAVAETERGAKTELSSLAVRASTLRAVLDARDTIDPEERSSNRAAFRHWATDIFDRATVGANQRNAGRFAEATHDLVTTVKLFFETPSAPTDNIVDTAKRAAGLIPDINQAFVSGARATRSWMLAASEPPTPRRTRRRQLHEEPPIVYRPSPRRPLVFRAPVSVRMPRVVPWRAPRSLAAGLTPQYAT